MQKRTCLLHIDAVLEMQIILDWQKSSMLLGMAEWSAFTCNVHAVVVFTSRNVACVKLSSCVFCSFLGVPQPEAPFPPPQNEGAREMLTQMFPLHLEISIGIHRRKGAQPRGASIF